MCTLFGFICERRSVKIKPTALKFLSLDRFVAGTDNIWNASLESLGYFVLFPIQNFILSSDLEVDRIYSSSSVFSLFGTLTSGSENKERVDLPVEVETGFGISCIV